MYESDSDFKEYSVYYDAPRFPEGQIPVIGEHFIFPGISLPIPYFTDEQKAKMAADAKAAQERYAREPRRTAADLDEECNRMAEHNRDFIPPYMYDAE